MCFIVNMKMGKLYNRWMGTIPVSKSTNKCVVITTISEDASKSNEVHWDTYVKRVLEMPQNKNLSKPEGIGITRGNIHLIHEHIICETLDVRINTADYAGASKTPFLSVRDVIRYLLGIMEGMELIHSYGFLHPGFSARKVLITSEGTCKLYDFCLTEDAAKIVISKKSEITSLSVNHFAPEALLRNEYSKSSDVWSTAVVIWQILSGGDSPFGMGNKNQLIDGYQGVSVPTSWPENYEELRNIYLFECWIDNSSLRPSIYQLRSSFLEVLESLDTTIYPRGSLGTASDMYVPMEGNVEQHNYADTYCYKDIT
ncbi:Ephrin type-A receptor 1 [Holothuria leucospilota]|uniref:Ephrin type-A receptor 1 n=1 Tax=Holothuria leucospilota TaxID=206669 RepID=A0A9Q1BSE6_HOLLE|nr:Ephrin type-A receptor 1 [Holothuria leucospilota]